MCSPRITSLLSVSAMTMAAICLASSASADTTTGFLTLNPWLDDTSGDPNLDDPDGVFWTIDPEWEFEPFVFDGALMFPTKATNLIQKNVARDSTVDLTTQPNVTSLTGYDPSTTELTGVTFQDPWRVGHFGAVPQDGVYNYWLEFTIETSGSDYKAASQKLDRATAFQNSIAQLGFVFSWVSDPNYAGDPFSGGGGIPLENITDMYYDVIIETIVPTTTIDQFGDTGFFNVEGFNVEYEVSSLSATFEADFDGDGDVDGADLADWDSSYGIDSGADANGDNRSDGLDFMVWQRQAGSGVSLVPAIRAVPEPSSAILLAAGLLGLTRRNRCRVLRKRF